MEFHTVSFSEHPTCNLDVYKPTFTPSKKRPILMYIHGGAWNWGRQRSSGTHQTCSSLTHHGFLCVSLSYRLSAFSNKQLFQQMMYITSAVGTFGIFSQPQVRKCLLIFLVCLFILFFFMTRNRKPQPQHPAHVQDVASAIAWVHNHGTEFGGDVNRIFLIGHSAGAHLASLVTCNTLYLRKHKLDAHKIIKGVICISGIFSAKRLQQHFIGKELAISAFGVNPEKYVTAFPINYIRSTIPPHFLINADNDVSLKRHTWDFYFALRSAGVFVDVQVYRGSNHFTIVRNWKPTCNIVRDIAAFVNEACEFLDDHDAFPKKY